MATGDQADPAAKDVIDYREALWRGRRLLKEQGGISVNALLTVQESFVHHNAGFRALPGTVLHNPATGKTI